jgi:hypothetical protein
MAKPPRIVPTVNKVAWADLSRVAGNLNQMNRALNEGRLTAKDAAGAGLMLMELRGQVDQLRRLLIGQEVLDESEG